MSYKEIVATNNCDGDRNICLNESWKPLDQSMKEYYLSKQKQNLKDHSREKDFQYHFQELFDELTNKWWGYGYFSKSNYELFSRSLLKALHIQPRPNDTDDTIDNDIENEDDYE